MTRRKVLFVAEEASLAQVVRLVTLAGYLDESRYDIHFASATFPEMIFSGKTFARHIIHSLPPEQVVADTRRGRNPYGRRVLRRYIEDDFSLLSELKPDLVVGDLRLSLAVAAPLAGVPLASLVNAYWRPLKNRRGYPLPDHPLSRRMGPAWAGRFFPIARPFVFRLFAAPLNHWRKFYGLRPLGSLPDALTFGDFVLYPDVPELTPLSREREEDHFLGPVLWAPSLAWREPQAAMGRKKIYVTIGSSGALESMPAVIGALRELPVHALVASAGRDLRVSEIPPNVTLVPYAPGDKAAAWADAVVCNGGATTAYQALAAGKPVVGIPSNLDQHLSMHAITASGAGRSVRSDRASSQTVKNALAQVLDEPQVTNSARQVARAFARYPSRDRFRLFLERAGCG